jgi:hypothetical protein
VLAYAPGFDRARTDDDLLQLYKDNMDPDLAPFRRKGGWSLDAFTDFVKVGQARGGGGQMQYTGGGGHKGNTGPDLAPVRRKGGWSLDAFTGFSKVGH